jgi:hypothetical protein
MKDQLIPPSYDPTQLFKQDLIYILLYEEEGEWVERSVNDLYVIKDAVDLEAALALQLENYGYTFLKDNSYKVEQGEQSDFLIHVDFKETLFPDKRGCLTFRLFPVKNAKEYIADLRTKR